MKYPFISEPLSSFLSNKNIVREVKSSSKIISFAVNVDHPLIFTNTDHILKNFKTVFFFDRPSSEYYFYAAGELTSLNEGGIGRFYSIDKKIGQIKSKILANWNENDMNIPLFTGGMKFTIEHNDTDWKDFNDSNWIIPELIYLSDRDKEFLVYNFYFTRNKEVSSVIEELEKTLDRFVTSEEENNHKPPRIVSTSGTTPKDKKKWKNMVNKGLEEIYDNKIKKIVLSRKVEIILAQETSYNYLLKNLQNTFPECAVFLFKIGSSVFFGATPEKLAELKNNILSIDALAGSASNSKSTELFSEKNLIEHDLVIDFVKNTISPFSKKVDISRFHDTKKLNNISHIWSEISAELNDGNPIFLVIKELFPTPAVCGIPRETALNIIKKLEDHRRGLYSGMVGWFNFTSAEFYVSIRSALSSGNKLTAYAGCGIVDGSDPEEEFDETELKLIPILSLFKNENKSQPQYTLG